MASLKVRKTSPYYWVAYRNEQGERDCVKIDVALSETDKLTGKALAAPSKAKEVLKQFEKLERDYKASGLPKEMTVKDWADKWLTHRKATIKAWMDDKSRIETHVLPEIGTLPLRSVKQPHIQAIFDGMRTKKTKRGDKVLSPATVRCVYTAVEVMFHDALVEQLIGASPVILRSNTLASGRKKQTLPYTVTEVEKLLTCKDVPQDRKVLWALLAFCGLRVGEGVALRWADLDTSLKPMWKLTVDKSYSVRRKKTDTTKTEVERKVPVHPKLAAILTEWRDVGFPQLFGRKHEPEDLIVPSRKLVERSSNHMLKKLKGYKLKTGAWRAGDLQRAGIEKGELRKQHAFRTTVITELRSAGVDKEIVRAITHGIQASRDVIDVFYTKWKWSDLCGGVAKLPFFVHQPEPPKPARSDEAVDSECTEVTDAEIITETSIEGALNSNGISLVGNEPTPILNEELEPMDLEIIEEFNEGGIEPVDNLCTDFQVANFVEKNGGVDGTRRNSIPAKLGHDAIQRIDFPEESAPSGTAKIHELTAVHNGCTVQITVHQGDSSQCTEAQPPEPVDLWDIMADLSPGWNHVAVGKAKGGRS